MKVPDQILDRIKGNLFKYAPEVYLHRTFYKTTLYLSRGRAFNYLNHRWALKRTKSFRDKPPETLIIETTNFCNAKCVMCIIPVMRRTRGSMSLELFEKIIEDANRSGIGLISLQHIGEPLMDEKLFDRIRLVKRYGLKVMFHTNGSLLNKEKAKLVMETGVDIVAISIDALHKETYERVRKGLSLEEVEKNVMNLMDLKKRKKTLLPLVKLNYVILDENINEARSFYNLWRTKVDYINVTFAHNWAGQFDVKSHHSVHITNNLSYLNPCDALWKDMVVFHDGRVPICCEDYEGKVIMGDLRTQDIMDVWLGGKFQNYRQNHIKNKRASLPLCNNCSRYSLWF